jgi:transglutaminase-like putative cysteine protease
MARSNHKLKAKLAPVLLAIHMVAVPLYPHMPLPVLLVTAFFTLWTLLIIRGLVTQPGRFLMLVLTATVIAVLLQSFGTIFGQQPGSAMLLLLSFLKLFEMKSTRDIAIVIFMGFFLIAGNFFYSQSLLIAIYAFVVIVYLTSLLIAFSDRLGTTSFNARIVKSLRMIIQAAPLMLILFILFPRIPGPLWGLPKDMQSASTGLSDEMSPGSINRLVSSGEVAFRVQFYGQPPPRSELYWRGLVLSDYDGKTWRLDNAPFQTRPLLYASGDEASMYRYTVMLEPHNQRWLYALESMVEYEGILMFMRELQLFKRNKVTDVVSYTLRSDTKAENHGLFEAERNKNLALPEGFNSQTVALAKKMFTQSGRDSNTYISNVLDLFRQQEFFYTLSPPLLGKDAMDDFLFSTRRGFCEHYSSAFVHLMRAAGIPARIVVGYQGGVMHPFDEYMIVRQSDAHAWAEVWLEDQGWRRIDPTAAVSPTRIERGIENAGLERDLLPSILISDNAVFQRARYMWDSFHNNWNQWIVGFNQKRQQQLFELMGFKNVSSADLVVWLVVLMTVAGGLVAWWVIRREPAKQQDVIKHYYDRFCRKLDKAGVPHFPTEGATEYMTRVASSLPAKRRELAIITGDYQQLRYGNKEDDQRVKRYIRAVRRFKVKRSDIYMQ